MNGICPNCGVGGFDIACELCDYHEGDSLFQVEDNDEDNEDED